jgi:hypothetical protein
MLKWFTKEGFTWWSFFIRIISEPQGVINSKDETNATRRSSGGGVAVGDQLPHITYGNLALSIQRSLHIV